MASLGPTVRRPGLVEPRHVDWDPGPFCPRREARAVGLATSQKWSARPLVRFC